MRILIGAVGRLKRGPERSLCVEYLDRTALQGRAVGLRGVDVREIPESRRKSSSERRNEEAAQLLAAAPDGACVIALDEKGNTESSKDFARRIAGLQADGVSDLALLIGGPDGHGPEVFARASATLSFGPMTWPHMLARAMLAEQLYRAVTILANHPYHRD